MSFSTRAPNRSAKPERLGRETPDALYRSAVVMCAPATVSRPRQWKRRANILLKECTASTPGQPKAHALLAYIHYLSGDFTAAEISIRRALIDFELDQEMDQFRLKKIDARKVPSDLRSLIPVALEWGIGDDAARGSLVDRASTGQKRQLRRLLPVNVRRRINDWLNLFTDGAVMTDEAACFMYLLEAYEEVTN